VQTTAMAALSDVQRSDFDRFYLREFDGQVRRAFLLLGANELANDVVQSAMLGIYRRWSTLADPGPYLNRAVLNGCRDAGRRRASHTRMLSKLRPSVQDIAPPTDVLDDMLSRLPFQQRAAVVLRYYGGFSTDEIAHALECPPGSVGPWIDRALNTLRKALQ
jgi:RNA polymerase sigma factor (sigma-70 family)